MIQIKNKDTGAVLYTYEGDSLSGASLSGANLSDANLSGANLYGAYLRGANLSDANLSGANLYGAYLRGANLYGADLRGANLSGAYLYGADLRRAKGILSFISGKDLLIGFKYKSQTYIKIGCKTQTPKDWLKNYKTIGKYNRYSKDEIAAYGDAIKLANKIMKKWK